MERVDLSLRAEVLLAMLRDPHAPEHEQILGFDGPWIYAARIPNIGNKTIDELIRTGLVEERPRGPWSGYERRWIRLASPKVEPFPDHEDFGDLWVA